MNDELSGRENINRETQKQTENNYLISWRNFTRSCIKAPGFGLRNRSRYNYSMTGHLNQRSEEITACYIRLFIKLLLMKAKNNKVPAENEMVTDSVKIFAC